MLVWNIDMSAQKKTPNFIHCLKLDPLIFNIVQLFYNKIVMNKFCITLLQVVI